MSELKNSNSKAGGKNTNKNGLKFESKKNLKSEFEVIEKNKQFSKIVFTNNNQKNFITGKKGQFQKYINKNITTLNKKLIPDGCKQPDEWFICEETKKIFIIEMKFQKCGGSVCEKLQTAPFKRDWFNDTFKNYEVHYIYCLSDWFKENCKIVTDRLKDKYNVPIFWADNQDYKKNIVEFIIQNS